MKTRIWISLALVLALFATDTRNLFAQAEPNTMQYTDMVVRRFVAAAKKDDAAQIAAGALITPGNATISASKVDTTLWYPIPIGEFLDTSAFYVGVVSKADSVGMNFRLEYGWDMGANGITAGVDTFSNTSDLPAWEIGVTQALWDSRDDTTKSYGKFKHPCYCMQTSGATHFRLIITQKAAGISLDNNNSGRLDAEVYTPRYTWRRRNP